MSWRSRFVTYRCGITRYPVTCGRSRRTLYRLWVRLSVSGFSLGPRDTYLVRRNSLIESLFAEPPDTVVTLHSRSGPEMSTAVSWQDLEAPGFETPFPLLTRTIRPASGNATVTISLTHPRYSCTRLPVQPNPVATPNPPLPPFKLLNSHHPLPYFETDVMRCLRVFVDRPI